MMKRLTNEEFKKRVQDQVGEDYTLLSDYKNSRTKVLFKHKDHTFEMTPQHFFRGQRCPKCNGNIKKDTETFKKEVYNLVGEEYEVLGEYINTKTKIKIKHNECGSEFEIQPKNFLYNDNRCPTCRYKRSSNTLKMKDFPEKVKDLVGEEYDVLGEYLNTHTPILLRHNSEVCDNNEFEMRPNDFLNGSHRCPKCAYMKITMDKFYTDEEFKNTIKKLVGEEYIFLDKYIDSKTKLKVVHNECGTKYSVTPNNFINQNNRCPHCYYLGTSKTEKEIVEYVKSIYPGNIEENFKINNKEFDIYIPELNTAFEYNGLYWHSEEKGKGRNYHLNKTKLAEKNNINLFHIFEDEWMLKQDIVKDKIKHILNLNDNQKIYARKTKIIEIDAKMKNDFLIENHIQGKDRSSIKLGMFHNKNLVAVMTFGKLRSALGSKDSSGSYELIRFATSKNYRVIGGFGKLFKHFEDNYQFEKVVTYADRRWSTKNTVYDKIGFEFSHISSPTYWYILSGSIKREHRYSYRKNILESKFPDAYSQEKTEKEIMKEANYYRVWDCGNIVYKYEKNKKD